ncbi:hypothetical protein IFM12275_69360 (plasmid) [Nocardia sputorum]|nr:hypothetical protein IFM12275_69360 [Nocardia sputorum]
MANAIDEAVTARGINKRAIYEIALRRELGLPPYPGVPDEQQEDLKRPA